VAALKRPFEAVADLWVSAYFGNAYTREAYEEAVGLLARPKALLALEAVERARAMGANAAFSTGSWPFPRSSTTVTATESMMVALMWLWVTLLKLRTDYKRVWIEISLSQLNQFTQHLLKQKDT
jgi:hypothetical protein